MPPDDLAQAVADAIARVRAKPTARIPDVALIIDRSANRCWEDARLHGAVAGLPVIRISEKSIRISSAKLLALVGLDDTEGTDL
jgi:hypothetical protein